MTAATHLSRQAVSGGWVEGRYSQFLVKHADKQIHCNLCKLSVNAP